MKSTLIAFYDALSREAHDIAAQPGICPQQLFNRLQWEGPDVLERLQASHFHGAGKPWLRMRMPHRESQVLVRTLAGHKGTVNCGVIAADNSTVLSAGDDYSLRSWDLVTGELFWQARTNRAPISGCSVSNDLTFAVSVDMAGWISVWDFKTGTLRDAWELCNCETYACDLHANNRLLAVACADGRLRVSDLVDRTLIEFPGEKPIYDCKFVPDSDLLISVGEEGVIHVWNLKNGSETGEPLKPSMSYSLRSCAVGSSGRWVAALNDRAILTVWNFETRQIVHEFRKEAGHHPFYWAAPGRSGVLGCAISPDESLVIGAAYDRSAGIWDLQTGAPRVSLVGHAGWIRWCSISADGKHAVTANSDETLIVWDLENIDSAQGATTKHYQPVRGCAFSPDGSRAISTSEEKSLSVWDLNENKQISNFIGHHYNDFLDCAIHPDGKAAVTTSSDNTLVVRSLETNEKLQQLLGHEVLEYPYLGVFRCAFSEGGTLLVSAGGDKTLRLWDTRSWSLIGTLNGHGDRVFGCAISPSGKFIVSAGFDSTVRLWDTASREERDIFRGHKGPVYCCAVSPDDLHILSGGGGGTLSRDFKLRMWDAATGILLGAFVGHTAPIRACTFTRDAAFALSASEDGTLRLWDLSSFENVATFFLSGKAYCVDVHPYKPIVASGDHGGNFVLLDLRGVELGPIFVTPTRGGNGAILRCPACRRSTACDANTLGQLRSCDTAGCGLIQQVNSFVSSV